MKMNMYLVYDLPRMAPRALFKNEQTITKDEAQLNMRVDVPEGTDVLFVALGDIGDGVRVLEAIPVDMSIISRHGLNIRSESNDSFQIYANEALGKLINQLNLGINNNPGLAPTTSFEYNEKLFQWTALSTKNVI